MGRREGRRERVFLGGKEKGRADERLTRGSLTDADGLCDALRCGEQQSAPDLGAPYWPTHGARGAVTPAIRVHTAPDARPSPLMGQPPRLSVLTIPYRVTRLSRPPNPCSIGPKLPYRTTP